MTTRNLDHLYRPRSVALIGASKRERSVGAVIARNLLRTGFDGPVLPVHPRHQSIEGVLAYPDVDSLPMTPDLAIIATPPDTVAGLIDQLGRRGTRAAVVITAGLGDPGVQQQLLDAAKPHMLRLVGPNTLGVLAPGRGLNASFAHLSPDPGHLAFVTQSGAVVTSVIDWAKSRQLGFSHLVSLGDMIDVDFGDMLDYLANDRETRAILLYIEGIRHARKFMSAGRAAARMKPVIVVKAGRHPEGARAAASHTGSLAGADDVYDAAFRRAGMLRVDTLEQLFAATETLADIKPPRGDRLTIVTNGGGMGVLATDELLLRGGRLAELSDETRAELNEVLPATWSKGNPVDIIGDAPPERLSETLRILLKHQRETDALLVLNCPTAVASAAECADALVATVKAAGSTIPILTSWIGGVTAQEGRNRLNAAGLATYDTPDHAVNAFMQLVNYQRNQTLLMETPPSVPEAFVPDIARAREIVQTQLKGAGEGWLTEADAKGLLAAYGVSVVETRIASSAEEAAGIAAEMGESAVLKILSPDITHKSDVGGVALDLKDGDAVSKAAERMLQRVGEAVPDAAIEGFTVQPMVIRPGAYELIIGMHVDAQFGPVLMFGQGGTAVEVVKDRALALPPMNMKLAMDTISRTRIHELLRGYRDHPAADLEAVALTMLRISQLVVDFPEIVTLDINPLLADERGVVVLDARVYVAAFEEREEAPHLAIRPYPKALETLLPLPDGRELLLRPIVPEDEPPLQDMFAKLTPEEIRHRFLVPMGTLTHMMAARFTQLDYDREMALVLTDPGIPGTTDIYAVVRLSADPDNEQAEFAIIVRQELTGLGLGVVLLQTIIDYARSRGIHEVWGVALREHRTMLELCRILGFRQERDPDDATLVRLSLVLDGG